MKKILIYMAIASSLFSFFIGAMVFIGVLISEEGDGNNEINPGISGENLSPEVLALEGLVRKYCTEYGTGEYVTYLLAIMQVESGGKGNDVMQCSESLGLPPDTLEPEASIKQGCFYFSQLLAAAEAEGCDLNTVIQSYNYGGAYISYVSANGKAYTPALAESFAGEKSGGTKVDYKEAIAVSQNGGWRYKYGNMFYVPLVLQYTTAAYFGDETAQAIMAEALKYQGWPYVFGGASPETSFDCSGLIQWCFGVAGISMPRTAQEQYEAVQHISIEDAQPGDLVFFHSTYSTSNYITHVGIYLGNNRMYHAGDPIGYADLTTSYYQAHFECAGRVK